MYIFSYYLKIIIKKKNYKKLNIIQPYFIIDTIIIKYIVNKIILKQLFYFTGEMVGNKIVIEVRLLAKYKN